MGRRKSVPCPVCGALMAVTDSRLDSDGESRRRRYRCPICGSRKTTRTAAGHVVETWHRDGRDVWTRYVA